MKTLPASHRPVDYRPQTLHAVLSAALGDSRISPAQRRLIARHVAAACTRSFAGLQRLAEIHARESLPSQEWERLIRATWRACRTETERERLRCWLAERLPLSRNLTGLMREIDRAAPRIARSVRR